MSAVINNIVPFAVPKKPRIREKQAPPDQRQVCVVPFRAVADQNLTDGAIRVLLALCSYCNKAGITWVSQKKLADDLKCSRQAITNQLMSLRKHGYVEIISKGFRGERSNTLRVIFDPTITAQDAIALVSAKEDARPPHQRADELKAMNEPVNPQGQQRVAQMIVQALKQPKPKEQTMPKTGDTIAVKEMKQKIEQAKRKRQKPVDNSPPSDTEECPISAPTEVSNEAPHRQATGHSTVSLNTERTYIRESIDNLNTSIKTVLGHELNRLIDAGVTAEQVKQSVDILLPLFQAEGITPTGRTLADAILQLHLDAR